jgi:hypothetical protein
MMVHPMLQSKQPPKNYHYGLLFYFNGFGNQAYIFLLPHLEVP